MQEMVCFFAGGGVLIALLIGALILRTAVATVNRFAAPPRPAEESRDLYEDWDWDDEEEEEPRRRKGEKAVPEPDSTKAMMITTLVAVVTAVVGVVMALFLEAVTDDQFDRDEVGQVIALVVFTLPVSWVGAALLFTAMLPTTFGRAAAVALVHHALSVGLLVLVGGGIALLSP